MIKGLTIGSMIAIGLIAMLLDSACGSSSNSSNKCGNGVVDAGETCDTAIAAGQTGACPTSCMAPDACTTSALQNADTCTATCVNTAITPCCGNGVVDAGETCDTAIATGQTGACPTSCTPPDACTTSVLQNAGTCTAECVNTPTTACASGGGCCPSSVAGVTFNMQYIPGGTFPTGTDDLGDNQTVSAFWMGETEVTYELWSAVYSWATSNGYTFANTGTIGSSGSGSTQQPVTIITWRDAMVWCNAASELAGLTAVYTIADQITPIRSVDDNAIDSTTMTLGHEDNPYINNDANGFQLPGSMEWECAARYRGTDSTNSVVVGGIYWTKGNSASGAYTFYSDVNDVNPANGIVDGKDADDQVAVYHDYWNGSSWAATGVTSTDAVKSITANALGIYDMSGNVWEWCFDWYVGGIIQSGSDRVLRGGSWFNAADDLQVGFVFYNSPDAGYISIGFRIMRTK